MATQIVESLDAVRKEKPLVAQGERLATLYDWALQCPGAGYSALFSQPEVEQLIATKLAKGLLSAAPPVE